MPTLSDLVTGRQETFGDALLGRRSGSLVDLLRQYGSGVKHRLGLLADDPAEFARGALLDIVPNDAEAQAARNRLMGGEVDPQAYRNYVGKMQDLGGLLASIRVYHGSPHKFDKFDLSKMGTGEGAQAYGHGAYVAESPEVAKQYAENLGKEVLIKGKPAYRAFDETVAGDLPISYGANNVLKAADWNIERAKSEMLKAFQETGDAWFKSKFDELAVLKPSDIKINYGHLYEANLRWPDAAREAADPLGPQHFLDWDAPLYRQPKPVRQAVRGLVDDTKGAGTYAEWVKAARPDFQNLRTDMLEGMDESQIAADLLKRGIPGVRYLDAGSRGKSGTSNYVVFDDSLIKLLTRNGAPIK